MKSPDHPASACAPRSPGAGWRAVGLPKRQHGGRLDSMTRSPIEQRPRRMDTEGVGAEPNALGQRRVGGVLGPDFWRPVPEHHVCALCYGARQSLTLDFAESLQSRETPLRLSWKRRGVRPAQVKEERITWLRARETGGHTAQPSQRRAWLLFQGPERP